MANPPLADVLKALGDTTRLQIVALLRIREFCVCELVPLFPISQPAISKHLSRLKQANLVTESRRGQWVYYRLNAQSWLRLGLSSDLLPDVSDMLNRMEAPGCAADGSPISWSMPSLNDIT